MTLIKKLIKEILSFGNIAIIQKSELTKITEELDTIKKQVENAPSDLIFLQTLPVELAPQILKLLPHSTSQLRQDLFVLTELNFMRDGFFVEFGATNGQDLSNSYILEKEFGWKGILAEPAISWQKDLKKNRSCFIEDMCVWADSGLTLQFREAEAAVLSTIESFKDSDFHSSTREQGISYDVQTISLMDLLKKYNAPKNINFLSIDTEGSELAILKAFDFSAYSFDVICCEHNHTKSREEIFELLTKHGYRRKYTELSKFDDWYVLSAP